MNFPHLSVSFPITLNSSKPFQPTNFQLSRFNFSNQHQTVELAKQSLSADWKRWIIENKQRQIPDQTLIQIMVQKGIDVQLATASVLFNQPLSLEWQAWIIENKRLNASENSMIQAMVREGIDRDLAIQSIRTITSDSSIDHSHDNGHQAKSSDIDAQLLRKLESILATQRQLEELSSNHGKIERRARISKQDFLEHYYAKNVPLILTDMMGDWPAMVRWSPDYLKDNYRDVQVEIQLGRNADPNYEINSGQYKKIIALGDYVDMVVNGGETNDYYLSANNGNLERDDLKNLLADIIFPDFLDPTRIRQQVFFWFGPAGTITPLHHDPLNLIMAHVSGRKRWRLISPSYTPLLYNYVGVFSQIDLENPDYETYPLFKEVKVIETVLEPGEIIFVPVGWWHQVKGLDISLSVSCTNFVFPNTYTYHNPSIQVSMPQRGDRPSRDFRSEPLTKEQVEQSAASYLIDAVYPGAVLIISFAFVSWEGTPHFDFYGRTKKLERRTRTPINRILVRDAANAWYHRGIPDLGEDVDQVAQRLKQLIQRISPSKVITIGQSMGGYAAIMFGQLIEADQVLAFGPLSFLKSQMAKEIGDTRWLSVMEQLEADPPTVCHFDLLELGQQSSHHPKLDIFYGKKADPETQEPLNLDDLHAHRLATLPNSTIHAYEASGHAIVQYLVEQKLIDKVLAKHIFS